MLNKVNKFFLFFISFFLFEITDRSLNIVCHTNGKTSLEVALTSVIMIAIMIIQIRINYSSFGVRAWFLRPIIDIDVINNRLNTVSLFC